MKIVENQDDVALDLGQLVEEDRDKRIVRRRGAGHLGERVASSSEGGAEGRDDVRPEQRRLSVCLVEREPGDGPPLDRRLREPLGQQCRLAEACGRRDERQPGSEAAIE